VLIGVALYLVGMMGLVISFLGLFGVWWGWFSLFKVDSVLFSSLSGVVVACCGLLVGWLICCFGYLFLFVIFVHFVLCHCVVLLTIFFL